MVGRKDEKIPHLKMLGEEGASTLPVMTPSQTILTPDDTTDNEHVTLAKKYPDSAERANASMLQLDGEEMSDLDAFIRKE